MDSWHEHLENGMIAESEANGENRPYSTLYFTSYMTADHKPSANLKGKKLWKLKQIKKFFTLGLLHKWFLFCFVF